MWLSGSEEGMASATRLGGGVTEGALASLAGETLSKRFCAWRGASERRYIASVFQVDPAAADAGLPIFDTCLVMGVIRGNGGRRILFARPVERMADRSAAIARGRVERADEWHVHFLAGSPHARSVAAGDITERHLSSTQADAA